MLPQLHASAAAARVVQRVLVGGGGEARGGCEEGDHANADGVGAAEVVRVEVDRGGGGGGLRVVVVKGRRSDEEELRRESTVDVAGGGGRG